MNFVMGYGISSHTVSLLQEPKANMASIEGIMVINSAMRFIVTGLFVILSSTTIWAIRFYLESL